MCAAAAAANVFCSRRRRTTGKPGLQKGEMVGKEGANKGR